MHRGEAFDWTGTMVYTISLFCLIYGAFGLKTAFWGKYLMGAGGTGLIFFFFLEHRTAL